MASSLLFKRETLSLALDWRLATTIYSVELFLSQVQAVRKMNNNNNKKGWAYSPFFFYHNQFQLFFNFLNFMKRIFYSYYMYGIWPSSNEKWHAVQSVLYTLFPGFSRSFSGSDGCYQFLANPFRCFSCLYRHPVCMNMCMCIHTTSSFPRIYTLCTLNWERGMNLYMKNFVSTYERWKR